ncbi:DUF4209 domain-containing protein [Undibacterium oligocarboniphilum]|uniref:DUF4209 domain-containing protein n=1 Tax=Undibacterium oligocarboniphilum TaxID=666702 RepID=A0A850QG78_9BURK|nr:DUF4209 domain-containing protein [Undibacterium oligocarboniphilum]MBC3871926.1 DUF4209 domain-containing protein [Undibacterium oligocarboniphilum]NVO79522.1 DUF4209 domain-containing protein [Undibacterium oligocarboniphilum]
MVLLPPAVAHRLLTAETAVSLWLDHQPLAAELEALVQNPGVLPPEELRGYIAEIIGHRFVTTTAAERGPWDSYFGPISSGTDKDGNEVHIPDAKQIDAEVIEYWKARAEQTPHTILRARYADLAWEIGRIWNREHPGQAPVALPRELAQRAAVAYLDSIGLTDAGIPLQLFRAWRFLERALSLALHIQDTSLIERAKKAAFDFNRANRAAGHVGQWWLIDDFVFDRKGLVLTDAERMEVTGWLTEALDTCSDLADRQRFEPHLALQTADRIARWATKSKQPELGVAALKKAAGTFETFAKQANAITAIAWLEDISIRYRQNNLVEDASRVDAEIIARSEEAKQSMRLSSVPISVSEEEMERWLAELMAESPKQAVGRIAFHLMSDPEELHRLVESSAANAPLHASISITLMDDNGFTTATIGSVEDDLQGRILNAAATYIGGSSPWLHQALARMISHWSVDAEALIALLTQSPLFPVPTHGLLREGIAAWYAGDFVKAVHVLVPQVEAGLREMLRRYGESPMRHNPREGGFETIGMGALLINGTFKEKAHPRFRLHMRALYTSPKGINLRNRVAHGLASADGFGLGMANWVIHSLMAIRMFGHFESNARDVVDPDSAQLPSAQT